MCCGTFIDAQAFNKYCVSLSEIHKTIFSLYHFRQLLLQKDLAAETLLKCQQKVSDESC